MNAPKHRHTAAIKLFVLAALMLGAGCSTIQASKKAPHGIVEVRTKNSMYDTSYRELSAIDGKSISIFSGLEFRLAPGAHVLTFEHIDRSERAYQLYAPPSPTSWSPLSLNEIAPSAVDQAGGVGTDLFGGFGSNGNPGTDIRWRVENRTSNKVDIPFNVEVGKRYLSNGYWVQQVRSTVK